MSQQKQRPEQEIPAQELREKQDPRDQNAHQLRRENQDESTHGESLRRNSPRPRN